MESMNRMTRDPTVKGGNACSRGLRVTVAAIVGRMGMGDTIDQVLADTRIWKGRTSAERCGMRRIARDQGRRRPLPRAREVRAGRSDEVNTIDKYSYHRYRF